MKRETLQKPGMVCLLAAFCCILWGSAFPSIKIGYSLMHIDASDTAAQILYAGVRFTLAGILTICIGSILNGKFLRPGPRGWKLAGRLSLVQTVAQYFFFYVGLANTSGVKASIIEAANVFFAILLAACVFRQERLTMNKIGGCLLGFAGVIIINLTGNQIDLNFQAAGEGAILISAIAYACSSVMIKSYSKEVMPITLSGYQFFIGGLILSVCGLSMGGRLEVFTAPAAGMILYLAFVSAGAYSVWGILLKYNEVSKVTVYGFINPLFGVILSVAFLQESQQAFGIAGLVSLILVCIGIYLVNRKAQERKKNIC